MRIGFSMAKSNKITTTRNVRVDIEDRSYELDPSSSDTTLSVVHVRDGLYSILYKGKSISAVVLQTDPNRLKFTIEDDVYSLNLVDHRLKLLEKYGVSGNRGDHERFVTAPMPGLVLKLHVEVGTIVSKNDPLLVLEAMKMENEIRATGRGVVTVVHVNAEQAVAKNDLLIELTPEKAD